MILADLGRRLRTPLERNDAPANIVNHKQPSIPLAPLAWTLGYVGFVLGLDVAMAQGRLPVAARSLLRALHLVHESNGFDWYKFVVWLVVPLAWTWRHPGYRTLSLRATRGEWWLQVTVVAASCLAMFVVAATSELSAHYLGGLTNNSAQRWLTARWQLIWTASWLPGYEFMLRRVLLQRASVLGPWWSVALVAAVEFVYHLQKPMLEAYAVLLFSAVLSTWATRRPESLHPILAHLWVELVLIGFLVVH